MGRVAHTLKRLLREQAGGAGGRSVIVGAVIAASIFIGGYAVSGGSGGACTFPSCFPDETNTGVPSGTTLTTYSGPTNITANNTVIDSKNITCLTINATNVTIRNSHISCDTDSNFYAIYVQSGNVTVEDTEIDCQAKNGTGVVFTNFILTRVYIHDCENGAEMDNDATIQDSYITHLTGGVGAHADGIQFGPAAGNINILHNRIYGIHNDNTLATSAFIADLAGHHDWLIEHNLFSGGAYTVYCVLGTGTNWVIRDNAFSTLYPPSVYPTWTNQCSDDTQSGNYVYETGAPLTLT